LHEDEWVVFDNGPNYLFHYKKPVGIVGILTTEKGDFDFRDLLLTESFNLEDPRFTEYRTVGSQTVAGCK
jgi:hypothetical protein